MGAVLHKIELSIFFYDQLPLDRIPELPTAMCDKISFPREHDNRHQRRKCSLQIRTKPGKSICRCEQSRSDQDWLLNSSASSNLHLFVTDSKSWVFSNKADFLKPINGLDSANSKTFRFRPSNIFSKDVILPSK